MLTKSVRRFLGVAVMAPLLLTACDSGPLDPFDEASGTYHLTFFDGVGVPVTFNCQPGECGLANGGTLRVNSGTLVLRSNGTFTETNHFTETPSGSGPQNYSLEWDGTYEYDGFELTLDAPAQNGLQARFVTGTLEFDTIAYTEFGDFFQYER